MTTRLGERLSTLEASHTYERNYSFFRQPFIHIQLNTMAVSMDDLISTMKTSAHVGQGSDLRELQVRVAPDI